MLGKNNLPRVNSLKSKLAIESLLKTGHKLLGDTFVLFWDKSEKFEYGILVPKRAGTAVKRNRIKRQFREVIRLNRHSLADNVKFVVMPRSQEEDRNFQTLNAQIGSIFASIASGA